jgi:2-polyprenyl-3-methyl-5-hydroxy-6-metoxy-1,4-benzoquinol methylase
MTPDDAHCPLCGSTRIRRFKAVPNDVPNPSERLSLRECENCNLAWQFPVGRSFAESVEHHTSQYQQQQANSYFDPARRIAIAKLEVAFLTECMGKTGSLFDVGAGDGTFVSAAAEQGWICLGIDPAGTEQDWQTYGSGGTSRLVRGTLRDLPRAERFDAITMWDVIEHLQDPEPILAETVGLLHENGMLVLETGNFQSVSRIESGDRWWGYAQDHRWYFSPANLPQLLRRAGYKHIYYCSRTLRPWWQGTRRYEGPSLVQTLKKSVRNPLAVMEQIHRHKALQIAAHNSREWAGLGIVTVVATKGPSCQPTETNGLIKL